MSTQWTAATPSSERTGTAPEAAAALEAAAAGLLEIFDEHLAAGPAGGAPLPAATITAGDAEPITVGPVPASAAGREELVGALRWVCDGPVFLSL